MSPGVVLREATRRDAAELAILVDIASHGLANWLWQGAVVESKADTALERGRQRMMEEHHAGCWKSAVMAELGGDIAGMAIGYHLGEAEVNSVPPLDALQPMVALQRQAIGRWYIGSLSIYRDCRGQGIGRKLLEDQLDRTKTGASLIVNSRNDPALALYRSAGFVEVARREAVPIYENSKRHDWVLMIRKAA